MNKMGLAWRTVGWRLRKEIMGRKNLSMRNWIAYAKFWTKVEKGEEKVKEKELDIKGEIIKMEIVF